MTSGLRLRIFDLLSYDFSTFVYVGMYESVGADSLLNFALVRVDGIENKEMWRDMIRKGLAILWAWQEFSENQHGEQ